MENKQQKEMKTLIILEGNGSKGTIQQLITNYNVLFKENCKHLIYSTGGNLATPLELDDKKTTTSRSMVNNKEISSVNSMNTKKSTVSRKTNTSNKTNNFKEIGLIKERIITTFSNDKHSKTTEFEDIEITINNKLDEKAQ